MRALASYPSSSDFFGRMRRARSDKPCTLKGLAKYYHDFHVLQRCMITFEAFCDNELCILLHNEPCVAVFSSASKYLAFNASCLEGLSNWNDGPLIALCNESDDTHATISRLANVSQSFQL